MPKQSTNLGIVGMQRKAPHNNRLRTSKPGISGMQSRCQRSSKVTTEHSLNLSAHVVVLNCKAVVIKNLSKYLIGGEFAREHYAFWLTRKPM